MWPTHCRVFLFYPFHCSTLHSICTHFREKSLIQEYPNIWCPDVWHFIHTRLMNLHQFHIYNTTCSADMTLQYSCAYVLSLYTTFSLHNTNRADTEQTVAMDISLFLQHHGSQLSISPIASMPISTANTVAALAVALGPHCYTGVSLPLIPT